MFQEDELTRNCGMEKTRRPQEGHFSGAWVQALQKRGWPELGRQGHEEGRALERALSLQWAAHYSKCPETSITWDLLEMQAPGL